MITKDYDSYRQGLPLDIKYNLNGGNNMKDNNISISICIYLNLIILLKEAISQRTHRWIQIIKYNFIHKDMIVNNKINKIINKIIKLYFIYLLSAFIFISFISFFFYFLILINEKMKKMKHGR
jgi:hypothetical protein